MVILDLEGPVGWWGKGMVSPWVSALLAFGEGFPRVWAAAPGGIPKPPLFPLHWDRGVGRLGFPGGRLSLQEASSQMEVDSWCGRKQDEPSSMSLRPASAGTRALVRAREDEPSSMSFWGS